jgi:D-arabinose 1-dehydrogenase-like Zn-dependent alcohol dehydrogenase
MTGVCRSDVDMMNGQFPLLPIGMMGHEGLGIVAKVGSKVGNIKVGSYVATRGEPAYADLYNCKQGNFIQVDELHPRYILEPVACGLNLIHNNLGDVIKRAGPEKRILIIGSGFLAYTAYRTLMSINIQFKDLDVVGRHNRESFHSMISRPNGRYDIVIDISSNPEILFFACMQEAKMFVRTGFIDIDKYWSKGYNRDTEWRDAFMEANYRPEGYNRGYIKWQ